MKYFQSKYTWLLYVLAFFALLNLYANYQYDFVLELASKPFLIPLLGIYFYLNTREVIQSYKKSLTNFILMALSLAWIGDIFLLFQKENPLFFILGLGSFLISHILYIITFKKSLHNKGLGESKKLLIRAIPFIGSFILMLTFLYKWLDEVMIFAVPIYMLVIITMAFMAMERTGKVLKTSAEYVFFGAFLFMVSDSLLAIDIFVKNLTIPFAPVFVMATYLAAQLLIVYGMIIQIKFSLN
ncbi:putative membrane protein [Bernardetia litoralis DSM 6794]|uniref:Putative membrane protein n=1 Tax=Bernardetia litoralis (strain ATCC 23117 / DSM 6794 / NBRC 15988 / NCIMB 1366 / Fx l1 / Sio-4) TaxID=880071 RepID=I4AKJ4_BERLS|nr:lysoplasmalogenase [Bernardetia litoralis]AFM04479.1 putative membrane protein [Bernardetia litoralis DSM 6794]